MNNIKEHEYFGVNKKQLNKAKRKREIWEEKTMLAIQEEKAA